MTIHVVQPINNTINSQSEDDMLQALIYKLTCKKITVSFTLWHNKKLKCHISKPTCNDTSYYKWPNLYVNTVVSHNCSATKITTWLWGFYGYILSLSVRKGWVLTPHKYSECFFLVIYDMIYDNDNISYFLSSSDTINCYR